MKTAHLSAFPGRTGSADDMINHENFECMLIVQEEKKDDSLIACRVELRHGRSSTLPFCLSFSCDLLLIVSRAILAEPCPSAQSRFVCQHFMSIASQITFPFATDTGIHTHILH